MSKFPEKLFVVRQKHEYVQAAECLVGHESIKTVPCAGKRVRVGEYRLVREVEVISEPQIVCEVG